MGFLKVIYRTVPSQIAFFVLFCFLTLSLPNYNYVWMVITHDW